MVRGSLRIRVGIIIAVGLGCFVCALGGHADGVRVLSDQEMRATTGSAVPPTCYDSWTPTDCETSSCLTKAVCTPAYWVTCHQWSLPYHCTQGTRPGQMCSETLKPGCTLTCKSAKVYNNWLSCKVGVGHIAIGFCYITTPEYGAEPGSDPC